ncbi:MAG: ABC transporter ATP-binding protein [Alphaproteobacteria bacterium HGW-Alphaproteobacteria-8]|nr:MAG: ABC transporter ATP-binding protein [Alphaproteobacteria bacterium HGW-Alphaproteobacteria-8]
MMRPLRLGALDEDGPPPGLWRYVWRVSGWRQLGLAALALLATGLNVLPIELQRRMIDDAILGGDKALLIALGLAYAAAAVALGVVKYALKTAQGWLSESVVFRARGVLLSHDRARRGEDANGGGATVSVLGAELDNLGGFVGAAPSQAFADFTMLLGVLGYMTYVKPEVAWISLILLVPNLVVAPLLQKRLNHLTSVQVEKRRAFGEAVTAGCAPDRTDPLVDILYSNRILFHLWKNLLKSTIALLGAAAPLGVLVVGGLLAIEDAASAGMIVAFLAGLQRIAGPIRDLIGFYRQAAQAQVQYCMITRWM